MYSLAQLVHQRQMITPLTVKHMQRNFFFYITNNLFSNCFLLGTVSLGQGIDDAFS